MLFFATQRQSKAHQQQYLASWKLQEPQHLYQFSDNCKTPSCTYNLKEAAMKIAMFAHFKEYHGNHKNFKSLYGFWDAVSKLETPVWILNHVSRSITRSITWSITWHHTWPNDQSQHDLSCGSVSLSIS